MSTGSLLVHPLTIGHKSRKDIIFHYDNTRPSSSFIISQLFWISRTQYIAFVPNCVVYTNCNHRGWIGYSLCKIQGHIQQIAQINISLTRNKCFFSDDLILCFSRLLSLIVILNFSTYFQSMPAFQPYLHSLSPSISVRFTENKRSLF